MDLEISLAPRILIAVTDADLRDIAVAGLRASGFCVSAPIDPEATTVLAQSFSPDILLVDAQLMTPEGLPLFKTLRHSSEQYVLCIAGPGEHRIRAAVLHAGADDAISTPLHVGELAARCHAMLRRPRQLQQRIETAPTPLLVLGPLTMDLGRREAYVKGEEVQTTRIEFSLLEQLCRRPTEVWTREELLDAVWGPQWVGDSHVVDVHLSNLRRKLDKAAPSTKVVHTVRGVGFRLANDVIGPARFRAVTETRDTIGVA
jgi:two-component system OmpR family response regulator